MIKVVDIYGNTEVTLENAYGIGYEKEANSIWSASFNLPLNDEKLKIKRKVLGEETYFLSPTMQTQLIETETEDRELMLKYVEITEDLTGEYIGKFRIMPKLTRKNSEANYVQFHCEHVLSTLLDSSLFQYHQRSNFTTKSNLEYLLNQQKHKHWKLGTVEFTRYFHYSWENENLLSAILSIPKAFDEPYIFTWDTKSYPWTLNLVKPSTTVVNRIKEGYNLRTLEIEENPMSQFNRIYPLGAGEGVNQLTIKDVNNGIPYLEDRKPGEEIREVIWPDQRYTNAASLKADAQALLDKWKVPKMTWVASAADVSSITGLSADKLRLGNVVRLDVKELPKVDIRIMKESKADIKGNPGDINLEIGNVVEDLGTTNTDLQRRQQVNELYSQGATNIMNFTYQDNCDENIPAVIPFYIDDDVVNVNTIELTYRTKRFRAYSQATKGGGAIVKSTGGGGGTVKSTSSGGGTTRSTTSGGGTTATSSNGGGVAKSTASGGGSTATSSAGGAHNHIIMSRATNQSPTPTSGSWYIDDLGQQFFIYGPASPHMRSYGISQSHSHSVTIPSHSHSFDIPNHNHTVTVPAHSHNVTIPNHTHEIDLPNHTHEIELPNHTHEVEHKIVEFGSLPSSVVIEVDGNTVPHTALNGDRINLVDYMSKDSSGKINRGRHEVTIQPTGLARIEADLICRVFVQSQLGGNF